MMMPLARLRDCPQPLELEFDPGTLATMRAGEPLGEDAGWLAPVTGTVYGVALNFRSALQALGDAVHSAPYKAPPKAPILYIKPRNTHRGHGATVWLPADVPTVAVGPSVGIVIGAQATRIARADAPRVIAGYTVVIDLAVPHDSYYRPAIRQQCRDGFCPIGPLVVPAHLVGDPGHIRLDVTINGTRRLSADLSDLIRPVDQLVSDVSQFMSLMPGDVLTVGLPAPLPTAAAGDRITVEASRVGRLSIRLATAGDAP